MSDTDTPDDAAGAAAILGLFDSTHHRQADDEDTSDEEGAPPAADPVLDRRTALVWGALIAVPALVILDGGVAGWAQWNARVDVPEWSGQYSLDHHVLAMVLLSGFTVAVASALTRAQHSTLGVLVLAAVAIGPMTIIASPVTMSLMTSDFSNTRWWWHLIVQGTQFAILMAWTRWTTHALDDAATESTSGPEEGSIPVAEQASAPAHGRISPVTVFCLYPAVTMAAQILSRTDNGLASPSMTVMFGWAMLGAAGVVLVLESAWQPTALAVLAGGAVALGSMYIAYLRPGGWPGVAGWDAGGQSPMVLSLGTTVCVLAGPLIGAALRRRHGTVPALDPVAG